MPTVICVDASFVIILLLFEARRAQVLTLMQQWNEEGIQLVVPPLFFAEVTSILRLRVYTRDITPQDGERAFADFLQFTVTTITLPDLQPRAWAFAKQYNLVRAYDAQYLAVADFLGCDFWTADQRLSNSVPVPWLHLV